MRKIALTSICMLLQCYNSALPRYAHPGDQFSHYKVVSVIGSGGMGAVYLAHDSRLDRQVALKVLLPDVAADQDRLNRFTQEALGIGAESSEYSDGFRDRQRGRYSLYRHRIRQRTHTSGSAVRAVAHARPDPRCRHPSIRGAERRTRSRYRPSRHQAGKRDRAR